MTDSSKAKIYLSDERGLDEGGLFRSFQTFNFEKFFNEYKTPFRELYVLNDETLAGGSSVTMKVQEDSSIILLPVVGAIDYKDSSGNETMVNVGEIQITDLPKGSDFKLVNPYEDDLINYLQLRVRKSSAAMTTVPRVMQVELVKNKNSLVKIETALSHVFQLSVGQFRGREEAVYQLKDPHSGLFVFVIEGAFEVQGRLLHSRDGLGFWDLAGSLELEALSTEAIVLLMEMPSMFL